jgi:Fe-S oxidoreductase
MLHETHLGLIDFEAEKIWLCVTCGACIEQCPREVEIIDFMRNLRRVEIGMGVGKIPDSLRRAMTNIASVGNPFAEPQEKRVDWSDSLGVRTFAKGMELLYFPGCFPAYDPRAMKVSQAIAGVLNSAEVNFGISGHVERCCGQSVREAGNESLFQSLVQHNIGIFNENGVKKILVTSPHCYHTFKNEYPEFGGDFEIIHYTQYFARLINEQRIKFGKQINKKVVYHDPCYLGRRNGIYDEPRQVLHSIPGLELVEMADSCEKSLCCGGGGGGIWMDTKKEERLSTFRLEQAIETGADILAVACPYCLLSFEDSKLTAPGGNNIEVKDIAELVWEAIW